MNIIYKREYSSYLNREMEYKVYGHSGKSLLIFPSQNGRFFDFENQGMIEMIKNYIESGKLMVFCVDSIDAETFSNTNNDESIRIELHEKWFKYISEEITKCIYDLNPSTNKILTCGCSMGAFHALNFFLRRPDIYDGVIGLSGVYHASFFFPNYHDSRIYDNSIVDYMANFPNDHPYINLYRQSNIILCIGKGRWEDEGLKDMHILENRFNELNIPSWFDYWGYDVDHDWPWWRIQLPYFIGKILC